MMGFLEALKSRQAIGQATGIVMERHNLTEREAFAQIVRISQNNNVKLRDMADRINSSGQFPGTA
ncbi:MAG: hypothetical protein QOE32_7217 [Pseudonocardiales bacterium]|nr:hypothetical protein [Pseudonocardiales bacterium]